MQQCVRAFVPQVDGKLGVAERVNSAASAALHIQRPAVRHARIQLAEEVSVGALVGE